jgi:hypothetical protein
MALRRTRQRADPFQVLGLGPDASAADVRQARTRLAKHHHPDVGGSAADMQRVNEAADLALRLLGATVTTPTIESERSPSPHQRPAPGGRVGRDHPSFTIEALPAEAFEALLIVANVLGDVIDDDPPYRLEVHLNDPTSAWCRIELLPEGGGSIVGLTVATTSTGTSTGSVTVNDVRDRFVVELNRLDWGADGPRPPLPS